MSIFLKPKSHLERSTYNVTIKQDHTIIKDIMFKAYLVQYITRNFQRQTKYAPKQFRRREQMYLKDLLNQTHLIVNSKDCVEYERNQT